MRDTVTGQNLRISAAQGVREPEAEEAEVGFQAASSDGSRVFFTDTARLTAESNQLPVLGGESNPADLYECEVSKKPASPRCRLKDLTPAPIVGGAEVLNLIPGVSEDGSYVYFIANGVLAPGASQGAACAAARKPRRREPAATCTCGTKARSRFSRAYQTKTPATGAACTVVGRSRLPAPILQRPDLADLTARVSPNGRYLAFMSQQPLTGYDNDDANHAGERPDQEVFIYDAANAAVEMRLVQPRRPAPDGVLDTSQLGPGNPGRSGAARRPPRRLARQLPGGQHPGLGRGRPATAGVPSAALPDRYRPAVLQQPRRAGAAGHQRQGGRLRVRARR